MYIKFTTKVIILSIIILIGIILITVFSFSISSKKTFKGATFTYIDCPFVPYQEII